MEFEKGLVSIVVMTYNNEELLDDTINSILNQKYRNVELIISDDSSKNYDFERMTNVKNKCLKHFRNVILNHNMKNIGTVKHFNKLIKMSHGEYIFPLSCGDVFFDNDVVGDLVNEFENSKAQIITSKRIGIVEGKNKILPNRKQIRKIKNSEDAFEHMCRYADLISGANTYYKKNIFDELGLFNEKYVLLEDCPYYINALERNVPIVFFDRITIKYDMGGVSTGKKLHPLLEKDMATMFTELYNRKVSDKILTKRVLKFRNEKANQKSNNSLIFKIRYLDVLMVLACNVVYNKIN